MPQIQKIPLKNKRMKDSLISLIERLMTKTELMIILKNKTLSEFII